MAVSPRSSSPEQSEEDGKSMARSLIDEDDTAVKSFVSLALTHRGHKVTSVEDGVQAMEALDGDRFDLLITDIVMPSLDGIGLALHVAKDDPALTVLQMTRYADECQRAHHL